MDLGRNQFSWERSKPLCTDGKAHRGRLWAQLVGTNPNSGNLGVPPRGCGSKPMVPFWGRCLYFSGDWDVHWGYGLLTHGHIDTAAFS